MSTTEREQEYVAGAIVGIIQKGPDKWQVEVQPDGSQYTKKLWTKSAEMVDTLTAAIGTHHGFVCSVSHWENQAGKQIRSLWLNDLSDEESENVPNAIRPSAAASNGGQAQPAVDWDAKERRDYRSRAWAQTISAMTHTIKSDEKPADIYRRLYALQRMIYRDIVRDLDPDAHEDDDIPFD